MGGNRGHRVGRAPPVFSALASCVLSAVPVSHIARHSLSRVRGHARTGGLDGGPMGRSGTAESAGCRARAGVGPRGRAGILLRATLESMARTPRFPVCRPVPVDDRGALRFCQKHGTAVPGIPMIPPRVRRLPGQHCERRGWRSAECRTRRARVLAPHQSQPGTPARRFASPRQTDDEKRSSVPLGPLPESAALQERAVENGSGLRVEHAVPALDPVIHG